MLSAKLVSLGNGILVVLFFDIGKWLFVLTLKSHLNKCFKSHVYSSTLKVDSFFKVNDSF